MRPKKLPIAEITFAAKLGFLPKGLYKDFFVEGNKRWKRMKWHRLSTSAFFKRHRIDPNVLVLNAKHALVGQIAPSISRPPYVNQFYHDEIVGRSSLAIIRDLPNCRVAIEAELKKIRPLGNKGRKLSQQVKHPDLLINGTSGQKIAVEIELNSKSRARYMVALRAYRSDPVSRIVYVIRSAATKAAITAAAHQVRFPIGEIPIGFCSLYDWLENPLAANVFFGVKAVPFGSLLKP